MGNSTCPSTTSGSQYGVEHVVGSLTFHDLTSLLCVALTIIVLIISGIHMMMHATHFSNPDEQVKILRVVALVPAYALVYLLAGGIQSAAIYFQPWAHVYESIALSSYFLLLITYVVPSPELRDGFFDKLKNKKGQSSLKWYRRTWILVFQYIPVSIFAAVVTDITQAMGKFCVNSNSLQFAHIWITIITSISVGLAFVRLLDFYKRLRSEAVEHDIFVKLFAIKGIIFLTVVQQFVFIILESAKVLVPSAKLSYDDIYLGMPSIVICGEMVIFALFHLYAYSARPYFVTRGFAHIESQKSGSQQYHGGPLGIKALLMALSPLELLGGLGMAFKYAVSSPKVQRHDPGTAMEPLRSAQYEESVPPPYQSNGHARLQRAHSPDPAEYGRVDQYTPLPRTQH